MRKLHFLKFLLWWLIPLGVSAQQYTVKTIAGLYPEGTNARDISLNSPDGIARDSEGNLYFTDYNSVRKFEVATGKITTLAGNDYNGNAALEISVTEARFRGPKGLAFNPAKTILYVADVQNHCIRSIDLNTGIVRRIAGSGSGSASGYLGENIPAVDARLRLPDDVATDAAGNIYFTDRGNKCVRKITLANGYITTIAGRGTPQGTSPIGDGEDATNAIFKHPTKLTIDPQGNIYIADAQDYRIRKIDAITNKISTFAGNGVAHDTQTNPRKVGVPATDTFLYPGDLETDADGHVYVLDIYVRRINIHTGFIERFAGGGNQIGENIPILQARLNSMRALARDANNNIYLATHHFIYKIESSSATVATVAGNGEVEYSGDGKAALQAQFGDLFGIARDAEGNIYFADRANHCIRKIDAQTKLMTTAVGTGALGFRVNVLATQAVFRTPIDLVFDQEGHLYITDIGNACIFRVDAVTKMVTKVAGGVNARGFEDGSLLTAKFNSPEGIDVDSQGNLYVADVGNHRIRKIDLQTQTVITVAGNGTASSEINDGLVATQASLYTPTDVVVDAAGNLYIADRLHYRVRKVDAVSQKISTIAGTGSISGSNNDGGLAVEASLRTPRFLALDLDQNLYISTSSRLHQVNLTNNIIHTVVRGLFGKIPENGELAINSGIYPRGVTVANDGKIYVASSEYGIDHRVFELTPVPSDTSDTVPVIALYQETEHIPAGQTYHFGSTELLCPLTKTFTIKNEGTAPLNISELSLTEGFVLKGPMPTIVDVGKSTTITIAMTATSVGDKTGTLTIRSANAEVPDYTVYFTGKVIVHPPANAYTLHHYAGAYPEGLPASTASVGKIEGMYLDAQGNLFLSETGLNNTNYRIRQIEASTDKIYTKAGTGRYGYTGNGGLATAAQIHSPGAVITDADGNIYFIEKSQKVIRKVDAVTKNISVFAGNGQDGFVPDGQSLFNAPIGTIKKLNWGPDGQLYFIQGLRIRKMDIQTGIVTTVVGNGQQGIQTSFNDGQQALETAVYEIHDLAIDFRGVVYFIDAATVRKVYLNGIVRRIAGYHNSGFSTDGRLATQSALQNPRALVVTDDLHLYIAESTRIRKLNNNTKRLSTVAGNGTFGQGGDGGSATSASINRPNELVLDLDENLLFPGQYTIRKVDLANHTIDRFAGVGSNTYGTPGLHNDGGPANNAYLNTPQYVITDPAGNLYISDMNNYRIRKVDAVTKTMTTIAQTGSGRPLGITRTPDGTIYVADGDNDRIARVDASGNLSTVKDQLSGIQALASNGDGYLYFTDVMEHKIKKMNLTTLEVTTIAGTGGTGYPQEGPALATDVYRPRGLAIDAAGNVYFTSLNTHRVYKIEKSTQNLVVVAGSGEMGTCATCGGYSGDLGAAISAKLYRPSGITVDALGNLYIVDRGNQVIRRVKVEDQTIETIAGVPNQAGFYGEGIAATEAHLYSPTSIALGKNGHLFIADFQNHRIAQLIPVNPDERKTQTQVSVASGNNLSQEVIQVWAYPNPTTDQVHLKITGKVSNQVIKIIGYNLQGQVMINTAHRLSEKQLRVVTKGWPQGIYLLKVLINQQIKTIRIYKQ